MRHGVWEEVVKDIILYSDFTDDQIRGCFKEYGCSAKEIAGYVLQEEAKVLAEEAQEPAKMIAAHAINNPSPFTSYLRRKDDPGLEQSSDAAAARWFGGPGSAYKGLFEGITSLMHRFTSCIGFGGPEINRFVADCTVELGLSSLSHNDTSRGVLICPIVPVTSVKKMVNFEQFVSTDGTVLADQLAARKQVLPALSSETKYPTAR